MNPGHYGSIATSFVDGEIASSHAITRNGCDLPREPVKLQGEVQEDASGSKVKNDD